MNAAGFFPGAWRMTRRLVDRRHALIGRMTGTLDIAPDGADGFTMTETGTLRFGDHVGPATRRYRLIDCVGPRATLSDEAGAALARFDLTTPRAPFVHRCPPDRYAGRVAADGPARWRLVWRVTGPRKDLILASRFLRI